MRGLPVQTELSLTERRALARREARSRVAPRLYAMANVLDGVSWAEAARLCGMDRQTLRDGVKRRLRPVAGVTSPRHSDTGSSSEQRRAAAKPSSRARSHTPSGLETERPRLAQCTAYMAISPGSPGSGGRLRLAHQASQECQAEQ